MKTLFLIPLLAVSFSFTLCAQGTGNRQEETKMRISVEANGKVTIFELNGSNAAKELYAQLPLSIGVENYSNNEKIFYPPKKLNTANTPLATSGTSGTLAYYAPWGDVVIFYDRFGSAGSSLYEIGQAIQGSEHIKQMSGIIRISKVE